MAKLESQPQQQPAVLSGFGVGVHYFEGSVKCPLAGVGSRGDYESNRLVIDDDLTEVVIDRGRHTIEIIHRHATNTKTTICDLMFLATGATADGKKIPFALHLKVFKTGRKISTDFHRHMRSQDELTDAEFDPYTVTVRGHGETETLLDPGKVIAMVRKPGLLHRVIKSMMAMRNHIEDVDGAEQDPDNVGYCLADLSMGFGREPLAWMMTRARLVSLSADNAALIASGDLTRILAEGAWRLELQAFTDKYLPKVIKRDLVLFGLDDSLLLAEVREHGLAPGQTMAFRFEKGAGAIELGGHEEPLENAVDVARAYLEFHMLGGLLVHETEKRIAENT